MRTISRRSTLQLLLSASVLLTAYKTQRVLGFIIAGPSSTVATSARSCSSRLPLYFTLIQRRRGQCSLLHAVNNDEDTQDEEGSRLHPSGNPYADPNYPDLEFVNYDDPEYSVDQGIVDGEFQDLKNNNNNNEGGEKSTEEQIEEMREERRRQNDEYQFQTYFASILKKGEELHGEWTVYKTSTFLTKGSNDSNEMKSDGAVPRLVKAGGAANGQPTLRVKARGYKENVETASRFPLDAERIRHVETVVQFVQEENDDPETFPTEDEIISNTYWPDSLSARDFRGHQGIMVCGNAWTICTAVNLHDKDENNNRSTRDDASYKGPFGQYRAEIGIQEKNIRLRLKFDYSVLEEEKEKQHKQSKNNNTPPPLHLKTLTVCREAVGIWPRGGKSIEEALMKEAFFGVPGADGGLYDPPPIRSEKQAGQYMLLDLEGRASVLFPYLLDQDPQAHDGEGWVHSLDWQPGTMRYQVDRKVHGGENILGLRTLELSEVQGVDAATYRPRDGGQNMRQ